MRGKLRFTAAGLALLCAPGAHAAEASGHLLFDSRLRHEEAQQAGIALTADALTWRNAIGWQTAPHDGLIGLIEVENVNRLGPEHYNISTPGVANSSLNGKTQYPNINDPAFTELNRAQLTWVVDPSLTIIAGRQKLAFDDQRFLGSPTWRQDDQTFDAVQVSYAKGPVTANYAYIAKINRNLGMKRDTNSDTHALSAAYKVSDALRLGAFAYLEDFSNSAVSANQTYGVRATGKTRLDAVALSYTAQFAHQSDYRGNTAPYSLDYYGGDLTAVSGVWTGRMSYESLEGDGVRGFITPISTTHGLQGWADAFAALGGAKTFVDGLTDFNVQGVVRPKFKSALVTNPQFTLWWHDFRDQLKDSGLGQELDAELQAPVTPKLTFSIQYADFQADATRPAGAAALPASRTKLSFVLEYRLP